MISAWPIGSPAQRLAELLPDGRSKARSHSAKKMRFGRFTCGHRSLIPLNSTAGGVADPAKRLYLKVKRTQKESSLFRKLPRFAKIGDGDFLPHANAVDLKKRVARIVLPNLAQLSGRLIARHQLSDGLRQNRQTSQAVNGIFRRR